MSRLTVNISQLFFNFLEAIQKYDITTFVGAFSLLFLWHYYKAISKNIIRLLRLHEEKHKKQTKTFSKIIDVNNYVLDLLNLLFDDISCARILIMQYHNGGYALNGVDFTKMSCTHEVIRKTSNKQVKPVQTTLLNIPITAYSYFTRQLRKNPVVYVPSLESIKFDDVSTYEEFKIHGAKRFICAPLTNSDGNLTGFIVFEFNTKSPLKRKSNILDIVEHYSIRISGMLESAGVYEENYNGGKTSSTKT